MTQDEIIETNRRQMFAFARGARMQILVSETRIHPDDEHLQYGPISTALREDALGLPIKGTDWFALIALHADGDLNMYSPTEESLFLLILAEALADEGM